MIYFLSLLAQCKHRWVRLHNIRGIKTQLHRHYSYKVLNGWIDQFYRQQPVKMLHLSQFQSFKDVTALVCSIWSDWTTACLEQIHLHPHMYSHRRCSLKENEPAHSRKVHLQHVCYQRLATLTILVSYSSIQGCEGSCVSVVDPFVGLRLSSRQELL